YTATWTATSAVDGHFTAGSFSYCVQDANGTACGTLPPPVSGGSPVSPLEVALRSIGYLGLAIAFGVGIMANFMWIPAGKDPDARGSRAYAVSRGGNPEKAAWTIQAAMFAALAAVVAGSLGTHAAAVPALTALGIAADAAHFGGIGLWFGGLAGIVSIRRFFREPETAPLARIVLGRFSRLAAYAVGLVLAGGIVLAVLLVGS